ncbi:hypothetical protein LXA43DRAFT_906543, partial [Ganoderma leucocontextum]
LLAGMLPTGIWLWLVGRCGACGTLDDDRMRVSASYEGITEAITIFSYVCSFAISIGSVSSMCSVETVSNETRDINLSSTVVQAVRASSESLQYYFTVALTASVRVSSSNAAAAADNEKCRLGIWRRSVVLSRI